MRYQNTPGRMVKTNIPLSARLDVENQAHPDIVGRDVKLVVSLEAGHAVTMWRSNSSPWLLSHRNED